MYTGLREYVARGSSIQMKTYFAFFYGQDADLVAFLLAKVFQGNKSVYVYFIGSAPPNPSQCLLNGLWRKHGQFAAVGRAT